MSTVLDEYRSKRDGVTIPTIAIWIVISLLVHVALLLWMPRMRMAPSIEPEPPRITAYLKPAPQPPSAPKAPAQVAPPPPAPAPATPKPPVAKPQPAPKPRPPVIALKPTPSERPTAPPPFKMDTPPLAPIPPITVAPPVEPDLATYIEARRRARGEAPANTASAEADAANRSALANPTLKASPPINFGGEKPTPSGGVFKITRRGYDYAEFMFYGWNINFRREIPQMIEVRKGDNSDIDIAVVRKIIEIIRNYERGDFTWHSNRIGKSLILSARARDNAGLEEFMMKEFYEDLHRYR
jgi:hypothetical protein